ncbi:MAG: DNA methyltransferase [Gallionella sp.]|nr:DNA methyltransferase [Gallionella sp.]
MGSVHFSYAQTSANKFNALFDGERVFDNPKPTDDIKRLIAYVTESDDIVLDFFAGSGTTAHAVLDLNQQDGGNRRFILVQLPEKTDNPQYPTIAHITRERVRRVIAKLQESRHSRAGGNPVGSNQGHLELLDSRLRGNDEERRGNDEERHGNDAERHGNDGEGHGNDGEGRENGNAGDLGFRAFKLHSSNFKIWRADKAQQSAEQLAEQLSLYADNVLTERGDQDRLYELILKCGMPLSVRVEGIQLPVRAELVEARPSTGSGGCPTKSSMGRTAFSIADGNLLICLEAHLDRETLRALFARKPQMVLCLDMAFDGDDALKTNAVLEAQSHGIIFKTV